MDKYFGIPYVKGGRSLDGLDCWGLVRLMREDLDKGSLPLFSDVDPLDKRSFTQSSIECISTCDLSLSGISVGAIACGYMGRLCYHVGIVVDVDNRLMILETDEKTGVCLTSISLFESRYSKVVYYD